MQCKAKYIGRGQILIPGQRGISERIITVAKKELKFELNQEIDVDVDGQNVKILTEEKKK
jgi:hypothetical protein